MIKRGFVLALDLALDLALALILASTLLIAGAGVRPASAQGQAQCAEFPKISAEAKKRADAVQAAMKAKADRKDICVLMTNFVAAEANVVKFLIQNRTWCGVPDQVITASKAGHEKSLQFRTAACSENAPRPRTPSLSDAIKTPALDSATNTSTSTKRGGTFDTLTGNPLAR